jgi:hypothetical protein
MLRLDHLALAAQSLDFGRSWFAARTGIAPAAGGAHPLMGTRNLLSACGPDRYVEIVAVDPGAPAPPRTRWFGLDDAATLADGPRLFLVLATDDLDAALGGTRAAGFDLGRAVAMTRGDLRWRIAVRDDGAVPLDGLAPMLIEWPAGPHPAGRMTDQGLRIEHVALRTPRPDALNRLFDALGGAPAPVRIEPGSETGLCATLRRPDGRAALLGAATEEASP